MFERDSSDPRQWQVRFSVIVPVYCHWQLVPGLLERIDQQTFPLSQVEVILVDNGSPDFKPPAALPSYARILKCETPGSYAARNLGASNAAGDWLVFTDADCLPTNGWLKQFSQKIDAEPSLCLLTGPITVVPVTPRPSAYEIFDIMRGIPQQRYFQRGCAATANLAVRSEVFAALGGFNSSRLSGGDFEFCRRARVAGITIAWVEQAEMEHPARTTWKELATKARRIKGGQLATAGEQTQPYFWLRVLAPPVSSFFRALRDRRYSLRQRFLASLVLLRLWAVGLFELVRVRAGMAAERR